MCQNYPAWRELRDANVIQSGWNRILSRSTEWLKVFVCVDKRFEIQASCIKSAEEAV